MWRVRIFYESSSTVVSVFIELQNLFSADNDLRSLTFTRPRVVLTRNHKLKKPVNLLRSKEVFSTSLFGVSNTFENLYSYTVLDEEFEYNFTFPQKSTDNIFKMASLSVKRSIVLFN